MMIGLGVITLGFLISFQFELYATQWLLQNFFDYFVFIVIVLFQDDLRRALTKMGKTPFLQSAEAESQIEMVDEVARAAAQLAKNKVGALMVIERDTGLKNFIDTGSKIDARVRAEVLYAVFLESSPLHDGAVIIQGDRIAAAGCFLPLSGETDIDRAYGTRHRAALGLTEENDAVVVLVSEEAGQAHLVMGGRIEKNLNELELKDKLSRYLNLEVPEDHWSKRISKWVKRASK